MKQQVLTIYLEDEPAYLYVEDDVRKLLVNHDASPDTQDLGYELLTELNQVESPTYGKSPVMVDGKEYWELVAADSSVTEHYAQTYEV